MALLRTATPSDLGPVIESEKVVLRTPQMSDYPAWAELRAASREFLTPWEPLWASDELSRVSFRRRRLDRFRCIHRPPRPIDPRGRTAGHLSPVIEL